MVLLLLAFIPATAWFFFPWYAELLIGRALEGKPFRIEFSGLGRPGFSGVGFHSMKAVFTTPPDGCSDAATYTLSLTNGLLSWDFKNRDISAVPSLIPKVFDATFIVEADSINVKQDPEAFNFGDRKPRISAVIEVSRKKGLNLKLKPLSAFYNIQGATVTREKLRL